MVITNQIQQHLPYTLYNIILNVLFPLKDCQQRYLGNLHLGALDGVACSEEKSSGTIRLWRRSN